MLTPFDDYPFHQTATPFANAGVSDYRFFDRYWFAIYDPARRIMINAGLGVYKNMNVLDTFVSVMLGERQHNIRVSRELRPDFTIGAGPIRYDIVEGLKSIRLRLDDNETGIRFDLLWEANFPAFEEKPHFREDNGWVFEDYMRVYQYGTVRGWVDVDGEHTEAHDWFGFRDRSWGVRSNVGGMTPVRPGQEKGGLGGSATVLVGFSFSNDTHCCTFSFMEDEHGARVYEHGVLVDKQGNKIPLAGVEHDLVFEPGTLRLRRADIVLIEAGSGTRHPLQADPISQPFVYQGFGYFDGYRDKKGLGAYRAPLHQESETYRWTGPETVIDESGHREFSQSLPVEYPLHIVLDGGAGHGECMIAVRGRHPRYNP